MKGRDGLVWASESDIMLIDQIAINQSLRSPINQCFVLSMNLNAERENWNNLFFSNTATRSSYSNFIIINFSLLVIIKFVLNYIRKWFSRKWSATKMSYQLQFVFLSIFIIRWRVEYILICSRFDRYHWLILVDFISIVYSLLFNSI